MKFKAFKSAFTTFGLAFIMFLTTLAGTSVTASADTVYFGDVNADGSVNALDASAVLRHAMGADILEGNTLAAADVDGSGQANALDASLILRYAFGTIELFPAGLSFETDDDTADNAKVLVAYFSATNTTERVAETLANQIDAELYEITPENPYTSDDLNYNDDNSRTTIEMNDPASRPAISGTVSNMEQYDVIFIGYPIWWGEAPRIINTFLESHDFSGKTIVPFCTSGGSGISGSVSSLSSSADGATLLDGRRFSGSASGSELAEWVNGLGLNLNS